MVGVYTKSLLVPVKRLDDLIADIRARRIKILKIDVEGRELEVLKGAEESLKTVDGVVLEVQGQDMVGALLEYLSEKSFNMVHVVRSVWNDPELQVLYFRRDCGR